MDIVIEGTVKKTLPLEEGQGKRGTWYKMGVLLEIDGDSQYPKELLITLWGDKAKLANSELGAGMKISAHINIESREYNDKYYTQVGCWKYETHNDSAGYVPPKDSKAAASTTAPATKESNPASVENPDDLPF